MNITNVANVFKTYGDQTRVNKRDNVENVARTQRRDEVVLSAEAQGIGQVAQALRGVPDVRMDKVNEFSQKISAGTYNVAGSDVADKLLSYGRGNFGV